MLEVAVISKTLYKYVEAVKTKIILKYYSKKRKKKHKCDRKQFFFVYSMKHQNRENIDTKTIL